MVATASDIKTILVAGTYPSIFSTDHIFDYEQVDKRRFYPSIEILPKNDNNRYDRKQDERSAGFVINIYMKRLGVMSNEIADLETIETEIESLLRAGDLVDNRIVLATADWKRTFIDNKGPNYVLSSLTFRVTELSAGSSDFAQDGFLLFKTAESEQDNKPVADYKYSSVFDTEISDGYSDVEELTVKNTEDGDSVPVHFSGSYNGTFVTNFVVSNSDVGNTGDKLTQVNKLRSNGEKPEICFSYHDDDNSALKNKIVEIFVIEVDQIQRLYRTRDLVVYRLLGKVVKTGTITISGVLEATGTGVPITVTGVLNI